MLLATAGCATTSPESTETAKDSAPDAAVPFVSETDSPAPVAAAAAKPERSKPRATFDEQAAQNSSDIWGRIRAGFSIPPLDSPLVEREARWFANNPEYMARMMDRAKLYLYYIVEEVEKRGMPMEIALLPAIESAYKPLAYSRARASGLWQFIPSTGRLYGLKANWWYDGRRDVQASTQAALDYLEKLYNDFDGDWHLAIAAYNAGEGRVMRARAQNRRKGKPDDYVNLKQLKAETRHYVPKLMAMASIVADPDKHGVQLANIPNEPYFALVETGSQVDLGVVAKLVDLPIDDLHMINPGYRRWATDPNGPHELLVPADKKDDLIEGLNNLPEEQRVKWQHHEVKRGETLSEIGRRYGLNVETLRTANNLRSNLLRVGQDLLIPISSRPLTVAAVRTNFKSSDSIAKRGQPVIHRVRRGDTLSSIARRYNVMVHQLAKWNFMSVNGILRLGQKIKIWPKGAPTAAIEDSTPNG
ncbi:MAG: LysM peptidoglycan-binding domain-containing protein [Pseudomonadota bacterium]